MTITIKAAQSLTHPDKPTTNVYPNNGVALARKPTNTFRTRSPSSTGVFPDISIEGSAEADAFHIHQISMGSVIFKVCVTFMKNHNHVGWAFYEPSSTDADTFFRWWSPKSRPDTIMRNVADDVFKEFVEGCPTVPANNANTLIFEFLAWDAKVKKEAEEEDKKPKGDIKMSGSKRDAALFGTQVDTKAELADDIVLGMIAHYEKTLPKIDAKDLGLVKLALKRQSPKTNWNMLIRKYYDGFFPG